MQQKKKEMRQKKYRVPLEFKVRLVLDMYCSPNFIEVRRGKARLSELQQLTNLRGNKNPQKIKLFLSI